MTEFTISSPIDGRSAGSFTWMSDQEVVAAVAAAAESNRWWSSRSIKTVQPG